MNQLLFFLFLCTIMSFGACTKKKTTIADCPEACVNDTLIHKKRVLILGIDGCRADALQQANTPNFDELIANGKYDYWTDRGANHTWSGAGWSTMLTGVWPNKHGVVDNTFMGQKYGDYPHFFCRLKDYSSCFRLASFCHWNPINDQIASPCLPDLLCNYNTDELISQAVTNHIRDCDLDVVFANFDAVDHAGHANGFHPNVPKYLEAIESVDEYCAPILKAVYERENTFGEEWLIVVSTDHGGKRNGEHGNLDNDTEVTRVFSIYRTPTLQNKGAMNYNPTLVDIVPTILDHLAIPTHTVWGLDGTKVNLQ